MGRNVNTLENIMSNTIRDEESGCLIYTLSVNEKGYPLASFKNKTCRANRLVYTMWYGYIQQEADVDHVCSNRRCLEPTHLRLLTHRENIIQIKSYVEKRNHRLRTFIDEYPQVKSLPVLLTLADLKALWDCRSPAHVKKCLLTMGRAYPEKFCYERFTEGESKNPALYAIAIHADLIDQLSNDDEQRETSEKSNSLAA